MVRVASPVVLGAACTPRRLAGCVLWLSAEREAKRRGLTTADTVALDQWTDLSGRGNHATQGTPAARPVLRHDGTRWMVQFDGTDDVLWRAATDSLAITGDLTILIAAWRRTIAEGTLATYRTENLKYISWETEYYLGALAGVRFIHADDVGSEEAWSTPVIPLDTGCVLTFQRVGSAQGTWYINGASTGTLSFGRVPATTANARLGIGARWHNPTGAWDMFVQGDIASVIVYNRALSDAERLQVERFLDREAKLGLSL